MEAAFIPNSKTTSFKTVSDSSALMGKETRSTVCRGRGQHGLSLWSHLNIRVLTRWPAPVVMLLLVLVAARGVVCVEYAGDVDPPGPGPVTVVNVQGDQVLDLCDAQCAAMCITLGDDVCETICGKSGQRRSHPTPCTWSLRCEHSGCTGSCSTMPRADLLGPVPVTPEVQVTRDLSSRHITLSWPVYSLDNDEKTVFLVSQKTDYCSWAQLGWVVGNRYTVTSIRDVCTRPTFKVAAVSRFGSRWFSDEVTTPDLFPGPPRNLSLKLEYKPLHPDKDEGEVSFYVDWHPPEGWPLDNLQFDLISKVDCLGGIRDKVYVYLDTRIVKIALSETVQEYVATGRIPVYAVGCKITLMVGSKPICTPEATLRASSVANTSVILACNMLPGYHGQYCKVPPLRETTSPGPVQNVTLTVLPQADDTLLARVFWLPPKHLGSGGYVDTYYLVWGLVELVQTELIATFKSELSRTEVPGNQLMAELKLNFSQFEPFESLGVVIQAVGPNQNVTAHIGDIHKPANIKDLDYDVAPEHVISNGSMVYVVQTNSRAPELSKVRVFWWRPALFSTDLDTSHYHVTLQPKHIDDNALETVSDFQDALDNMTSIKEFDTTVEYLRIDDLQPNSTYILTITLLGYLRSDIMRPVRPKPDQDTESEESDGPLKRSTRTNDMERDMSTTSVANTSSSEEFTLIQDTVASVTLFIKPKEEETVTDVEPKDSSISVKNGRASPDDHQRLWVIVVTPAILLVVSAVASVLAIKLYRNRKLRFQHISSMDISEFRPYLTFAPNSGCREGFSSNTPVVADHWEIPLCSLKFGPVLGQGAFGTVALGRVSRAMLTHRGLDPFMADGGHERLKDGDKLHATVAIKMLLEGCDQKLREDFLKEIRLMKRIGYHRNVVSMLACLTLREPLCLLVEHVTRGDLHNFMRKCRVKAAQTSDTSDSMDYVNESDESIRALDLVRFASDIARGMAPGLTEARQFLCDYNDSTSIADHCLQSTLKTPITDFLTSNGFVHRDLAARNVLVAGDKTCKIGDFGLARYVYDNAVYVNRRGGRLPIKWMSVEAIFDQSFSPASDVWSFGVLLYELVTLGGVPYPTVHTRDLLRRLQAGYRMPRPDNCLPITTPTPGAVSACGEAFSSAEFIFTWKLAADAERKCSIFVSLQPLKRPQSSPLFGKYMMMLECWRKVPGQRPSFNSLESRLSEMLNAGTDLVDEHGTFVECAESHPAQVSTSSDDGLLLVTQSQDTAKADTSDETADTSEPIVVFEPIGEEEENRSDYNCPLHLVKNTLESMESIPLQENRFLKLCRRSSQVEAVSQDSGFEPSPKVSESGSESNAISLRQMGVSSFEEADSDNFMVATTSFLLPALSAGKVEEDLGKLDNDVFETDPQCFNEFPESNEPRSASYLPVRSRSEITMKRKLLNIEESFSRRWQSDSDLAHLAQAAQGGSESSHYEQRTNPTAQNPFLAPGKASKALAQTAKRERRKAVVRPPTLAMDNETYLDSEVTFRQLPPPTHIFRRARGGRRPTDSFSSSFRTRKPTAREVSNSDEYIEPMQNLRSDGKFHRIIVQVHQQQNTVTPQASSSISHLKSLNVKDLELSENALSLTRPHPTHIGKLVARGTRKFIRPPDIAIVSHVETESSRDRQSTALGNRATDSAAKTAESLRRRDFKRLLANSTGRSSLPHMPVSPVRYVHFQFPGASPNSCYKRSLSEDNILASALESQEFRGLPKTMRGSALLTDPLSKTPSSGGSITWPDVSTSMGVVASPTQAAGACGYIPVRRFSDPSSLPVSFIRRHVQGSCSSSASSCSDSAIGSKVSPEPRVTQFYTQAVESPSSLTDMHFHWPTAPWEGKKVSWSSHNTYYDINRNGISDGDAEGNRGVRGARKECLEKSNKFVKEKHPFALYQV